MRGCGPIRRTSSELMIYQLLRGSADITEPMIRLSFIKNSYRWGRL